MTEEPKLRFTFAHSREQNALARALVKLLRYNVEHAFGGDVLVEDVIAVWQQDRVMSPAEAEAALVAWANFGDDPKREHAAAIAKLRAHLNEMHELLGDEKPTAALDTATVLAIDGVLTSAIRAWLTVKK